MSTASPKAAIEESTPSPKTGEPKEETTPDEVPAPKAEEETKPEEVPAPKAEEETKPTAPPSSTTESAEGAGEEAAKKEPLSPVMMNVRIQSTDGKTHDFSVRKVDNPAVLYAIVAEKLVVACTHSFIHSFSSRVQGLDPGQLQLFAQGTPLDEFETLGEVLPDEDRDAAAVTVLMEELTFS